MQCELANCKDCSVVDEQEQCNECAAGYLPDADPITACAKVSWLQAATTGATGLR